MDEDRIKGTAREWGGRAKEAMGSMAGDAKTQVEGRMNRMAGQAQNAYGRASDQMRDGAGQLSDAIRDRPITALLVAAGIGWLVGKIGRYV
jgi:uncharacterized protein YjbJ (UPF0337 family)